jgi:hypothetical protein
MWRPSSIEFTELWLAIVVWEGYHVNFRWIRFHIPWTHCMYCALTPPEIILCIASRVSAGSERCSLWLVEACLSLLWLWLVKGK